FAPGGTPCRARTFARPRYGLEVGVALCAGNGTTFAFETQGYERSLARRRNLHTDRRQVVPSFGLLTSVFCILYSIFCLAATMLIAGTRGISEDRGLLSKS